MDDKIDEIQETWNEKPNVIDDKFDEIQESGEQKESND